MDTLPTVSAIIGTRNRQDTIRAAVESVLASAYPRLDVIVIDQSPSPDTECRLEALVATEPRLRYVRMNEMGASRARNAGVQRTSGDIIAFTDDDCVVARDWIERIVAAFERDPEADLVYGPVYAGKPKDELSAIPALPFRRAGRFSRRDGFRVFGMSANVAARRRLFDRVGGFDVSLGPGSSFPGSEDFDLAYRVYQSGHAILLRPEIRVVHYGARATHQWPHLNNSYGRGNGAFYAKHARCRDPFMCCLLLKDLGIATGKTSIKRLLGRPASDYSYVRGFITGMRESLRIPVNCETRLYEP